MELKSDKLFLAEDEPPKGKPTATKGVDLSSDYWHCEWVDKVKVKLFSDIFVLF